MILKLTIKYNETKSLVDQMKFMQDAIIHGVLKSTTLLPTDSVYTAKVSPASIMYHKRKAHKAIMAEEEKRD